MNTTINDILTLAADYEDGIMGMDRCIEIVCEEHSLSDEICDLAKLQNDINTFKKYGVPLPRQHKGKLAEMVFKLVTLKWGV